MTLETTTAFFGWCTVINAAILLFSTVMLAGGRNWSSKIHANMFGLEASAIRAAYFQYLAQYKIATITLNLTPYLALKLMASTAT